MRAQTVIDAPSGSGQRFGGEVSNEHDPVRSYGTRALRLWAKRDAEHFTSCPCLICADGRALRGAAPLELMISQYRTFALPVERTT